jgi:hypothetical protein
LDKWIEEGNEICTNSLSIVMMRTQNVRQHDNIKKDTTKDKDKDKDRDREKDKEKDKEDYYEERSRERGSVDDNTDEYLSSNKNEFQIHENIISDDIKRKYKNNENLIENEFSEEEIMKNSKNMSNYFRITENELENLCTKIIKFNMNSDNVSTTGERVREHDERGMLLKSCVFDAELSDLLETVLLNKDKDVYVVSTGKEKNIYFYFYFIFIFIFVFHILFCSLLSFLFYILVCFE